MFTPSERAELRAELIARARADPRITAAALAGSAARDAEDDWSDIDLVLRLAPDADEPAVVDDWTRLIDRLGGLADTLDVLAGGIRYRVCFLDSSLQLDVSFWPHEQFRATEPAFRLVFGTANAPTEPPPIDVARTIGTGWLYAIHARSAVARGKLWQATMMLDELRGILITLMCARAGLNPWHGRDADALPRAELEALDRSRAAGVHADDLEASRVALSDLLLAEIARHDAARAGRLRPPFDELRRPAR